MTVNRFRCAVAADESPKKTIAAIDIGSNSAHLAIAEMDHAGEMRLIDTDRVALRLGEATDDDGNLTTESMDRCVAALSHMREILSPYRPMVRAVATHAVREARNFKVLLARLEREANVKVDVIDGVEEARLAFLGMRYGLAIAHIPCLGVDVGGGSSELIIARDDEISYVSSVKLGAVTLTRKYFKKQGYNKEALAALKAHIHARLGPLPHEARRHRFERAIASSGTAKALASWHASEFRGFSISDVNGYRISRSHFMQMIERLERLLTPERIKDETDFDSGRSEVVLAGALVLAEITKALQIDEWTITSFGLREGLVADTFYRSQGHQSKKIPDIQWHSVLQFGQRLGLAQDHAIQVKKLSVKIYDGVVRRLDLAKLKGDDAAHDANIKLLKAAAYLREAGKFLSAPQYHHHSQYLIANSRLPGFTESERLLMGLVARFQRKSIPSADHRDCGDLNANELNRLRLLAACVRLAAALDRTRQSRVRDLRFTGDAKSCKIQLLHAAHIDVDVELHKAQLEKNALEKSFGLKLQLEA